MTIRPVSRYNNIAISLHWLMAFFIVGMLAVGKYMTHLDETDPLRFTLTQWHKTFGILILLLAVVRLCWRLTHRSPAHPANAPKWEHVAAKLSHIGMYALLFIAPITGWMLVSVSPLNIDTLLFNTIPWPHLPWLHNLADKASAVHQYEEFHEWATGAMIALLLLHIAAALKHHFIDKDNVLTGMLPSRDARTGRSMLGVIALLVLSVGGAVFGYGKLNSAGVQLSSGNSVVSAVATVMGGNAKINFVDSSVSAQINPDSLDTSSLIATVPTASVTSNNQQVQGSLPDTDWFDSANHPEARFESSNITALPDTPFNGTGSLNVEGVLTIKGISQPQTFTLEIVETDGNTIATGEFIVDRTAYNLGMSSQPSGEYVGNEVTVAFEFEILPQP